MSEEHYVALRPLRFGRQELQPGDPVPLEPGRDYRLMRRLGQIGPAHAGAAATPQNLSTPAFTQGQRVVFVGQDGAHELARFLSRLQANPENAEALDVLVGAAVAAVQFEDDPNPVVVRLDSLLPEQPTLRLIEDLNRAEDPPAPTTPWQEGSLVVWVNADGAPQLMTFDGLDNPGDVQSARVRPLAEDGQPHPGVQQVRLEDLLPGVPATRLLAFEQNRVAEAAATHAQASEVQLALVDKLEERITFLELLVRAVRENGEVIPGDFPAAEQLAQNGVETLPGLRILVDGEQGRANLMALDAIGASRADKILAAVTALAPADPPAPEG